jgi:hypothetical protein
MLASNLYFVKGVKKRKMIMNYIQKVLAVFFVIGFISICVTHQSIAESNFQEIISFLMTMSKLSNGIQKPLSRGMLMLNII